MNTEGTFWRLLGDYERLTRDESFAIKEENFAAVSELSTRKGVLVSEMNRIGKALGIDRSHPALKSRIDSLIETEQRNTALVNKCILKLRGQQEILESATKRLRTFERVYTWDSRAAEQPHGRFCAAG